MKKLEHREVKYFAQGHTAGMWQITDSNSGHLVLRLRLCCPAPPPNTPKLRNSLRKYTREESIYISEFSNTFKYFHSHEK